MKNELAKRIFILSVPLLLAVGLALFFTGRLIKKEKATEIRSPYLYADTRQLVDLVEEAAGLMEQQGEKVFETLKQKDSRWLNKHHYFFVYDIKGKCIFHPVEPHLVGRNLMNLRDMNGKLLIREITQIGEKPGRSESGWVFYLWEEGMQISPMWKSSYIRKVIGPDGKIYLIGCGSYDIKIEKEFVRERVGMAADLIAARGSDVAFREFRNPASPFYFLDTYIFVLGMNGKALVDPAYPTFEGRDLSRFKDVVGHEVVQEMLQKLAHAGEAWVQYLWPRPGDTVPSRKLAYVRKVRVGQEELIVGADFFLATPIWMKI